MFSRFTACFGPIVDLTSTLHVILHLRYFWTMFLLWTFISVQYMTIVYKYIATPKFSVVLRHCFEELVVYDLTLGNWSSWEDWFLSAPLPHPWNLRVKGKRGKPCVHTGGRVQPGWCTRGNTSPHYRQQLEERERQGCDAEDAGLVTSTIINCVRRMGRFFRIQEDDEIPRVLDLEHTTGLRAVVPQ